MRGKCFLTLIISIVFLPAVSASTVPNVTLISPADGNISVSENVTFVCNATDDLNVYSVSLYNDLNGTFGLYGTKNVMGLDSDVNTTLLCHFDDTYTCDGGEEGISNSTDFVNSRFNKGVRINNPGTLDYPTLDNIEHDKGTVEFWFRTGFNATGVDHAWLFSIPGDQFQYKDKMSIYVENGTLNFDYSEPPHVARASKNISWNEGEWHYIAGIWENADRMIGNDKILDLFLDGSNDSDFYSRDFYYGGAYGDNLYIGSDPNGENQSNSVFDELRISNQPRLPSEINSSYAKGFGNHTSESVNWTITNIPEGFYKWNCMARDNESFSRWNETNRTFYVDLNPPVTNSVIISPNTSAELDPGVTINVTANVTDVTNISSVILQWTRIPGNWMNNETMKYNSLTGLYENATINATVEGTYFYRIWSNDTVGHSGNSTTYNLTADLDYTWTRTPSDLGTTYGFVGCTNCCVGTLVINNTGDDVLSFAFSHNWPLEINYNISNPFSVAPKSITIINVTARFSDNPSEYDIIINITATAPQGRTPSPASQILTATFNTQNSSGGPYFDNNDISVFAYPTNAYQGRSYNLSAKLKNIGNESATGVWINWTLPSGWANTSGDLNKYAGILNGTAAGGNIAWNNVIVYLASSIAAAGIQNLTIKASSSENKSANASAVTYVSCSNDDGVCGLGCSYVTDDDCSVPSGGAGTASTYITGIAKEYKIELVVPSRLDINRGESKILRVGVNNNVSGTKLKNVYLSLSGYTQTFLSFSPRYIGEIGYGETKYFDVEIKAPIYAVYGEYNLNITASGKFAEGEKTTGAEKSGVTLLVTHKFIGNETMTYFGIAEEALNEMKDAGLDTRQMSDLIAGMNKTLGEGNYDMVKELANEAASLRDSAFSLSSQIQDTQEKIEGIKSQNIGLPESEKMLSLTKSAFLRGDYAKAEERLSSTMLIFAVESGGAQYRIFLASYWWILAPVIFAAGTGMILIRKRMSRASLAKKLDKLADEERVMQELTEGLQKEHFIDRKIGAESYERSMKNYENGLNMVRKRRAEVLLSLSKRLKSRDAAKRLDEEEKRVKDLIIDAQKRYFERGKIGKSHYDRTMGGLRWELLEVQRIKEALESGKHA